MTEIRAEGGESSVEFHTSIMETQFKLINSMSKFDVNFKEHLNKNFQLDCQTKNNF